MFILNAMEGAFDFFYGVAEHDRAPVRAAHRAIGFGESCEEPLHFCLIERHVDLDRGVTSGAGGDFGLQRFDRDRGVFAFDAVENFGQQLFGVGSRNTRGNGLNRYAARAHGFDLETIGGEFVGDFFVDDELARREFENHRHEHALAFDFSGAARFEMLLKKDAFVRDVLVDDPEPFAVHGDDEARADLAQRFEVGDFVGMWETAGGISGAGKIRGPVWLSAIVWQRRRMPALPSRGRRRKLRQTRRRNVEATGRSGAPLSSKPPSEPTPEPMPMSSSAGMFACGIEIAGAAAEFCAVASSD